MERLFNGRTKAWFEVSNDDFDTFQDVFCIDGCDTSDVEYAIEIAQTTDRKLSRKYTDAEIRAIFQEHAELTGMDKEIAKNNVADPGDRRKAEEELKKYIKASASNRKQLSLKSARTLLKVVEAFERYECNIEEL